MSGLRRACGVFLLGALGFGTAFVFVGSGSATAALPTTSLSLTSVTVPTLTVPTLPTTTTVTVPPLPTTTATVTLPTTTATATLPATTSTVPLPPPPVSTASVLSPTASAPPPSVRTPTTAAPSGGAAQPSTPSGSAATSSGGQVDTGDESSPPAARRGSAPARVEGFDLSRDRFVNRGKNRRAVVIRFRLSRAARLVLLVRGPGPSCETVARIPVRGRAGANRLRFAGWVDGRPLEHGTYLLTLRQRGRTAQLGREHVTIVSAGATGSGRVLPRCDAGGERRVFVFGSEWIGTAGEPAIPASPAAKAAVPPSMAAPESGVRGEESPASALPWPLIGDEVEELPPVLAVVLLGLLIGSLLGVVGAVVHYLRSPQV